MIRTLPLQNLRPCGEGGVNFNNIVNLYIEDDNLEVAKRLLETCLSKVKAIANEDRLQGKGQLFRIKVKVFHWQ